MKRWLALKANGGSLDAGMVVQSKQFLYGEESDDAVCPFTESQPGQNGLHRPL